MKSKMKNPGGNPQSAPAAGTPPPAAQEAAVLPPRERKPLSPADAERLAALEISASQAAQGARQLAGQSGARRVRLPQGKGSGGASGAIAASPEDAARAGMGLCASKAAQMQASASALSVRARAHLDAGNFPAAADAILQAAWTARQASRQAELGRDHWRDLQEKFGGTDAGDLRACADAHKSAADAYADAADAFQAAEAQAAAGAADAGEEAE